MFKKDQIESGKPSPAIISEAKRLWGKTINKLTWEEIDLGSRNLSTGQITTFHCPHGNVCEMIELHSFTYQENGRDVQYGIGRCLSCAKIYWGRINQD